MLGPSPSHINLTSKGAISCDIIRRIQGNKTGIQHKIQLKISNNNKPSNNSFCSHGHPHRRLLKKFQLLSTFNCWVKLSSSAKCAEIDLEWSERFIQHMPSNSWHPCPCTSSKKSIAARFCRVACRMESMSTNNSFMALVVALVSLANQHSSLRREVKAWAAATPGTKKEAKMVFSAFQKVTLLLQFFWKVSRLCRFPWGCRSICSADMFGCKRVSRPRVHGPPRMAAGSPYQALSPHNKKSPSGRVIGVLNKVVAFALLMLHHSVWLR